MAYKSEEFYMLLYIIFDFYTVVLTPLMPSPFKKEKVTWFLQNQRKIKKTNSFLMFFRDVNWMLTGC